MTLRIQGGHGWWCVLIAAALALPASTAAADTKLPQDIKKLPKPTFVPAPTGKMISAAATRKAKVDTAVGLRHLRTKKYAKAIAAFKAALANNPNSQRARYHLAAALVVSGERAKGLALLAQLEKLKCKVCLARGDDHFASVWRTIVFNLIVLDHGVDRYINDGWHLKPGGCPRGTKRRGGTFEDESSHGVAYCTRGRLKHGPYVMVTNSGPGTGHTFNIEGMYRRGRRVGLWSVGVSHTTNEVGIYRNGKRHGLWTGVVAAGGLASMGVYRNGKKHGKFTKIDPHGFRSIGHYKRGVRHGEFSYWNKKTLLAKTTLTNGNGAWLEYDGGTLVEKGTLKRGKKVGPWIEKGAKGTYRNGKRHGAWTFHQGKTLRATGSYRYGKPDGKWRIKGFEPKDAQELVFRRGYLTTVDDRRASKADRKIYRQLVDAKMFPGKIEKNAVPPWAQ